MHERLHFESELRDLDITDGPLLSREFETVAPAVVADHTDPPTLTRIVRQQLGRASRFWPQVSAVYFPPKVPPRAAKLDVILYLHGHRTAYPGSTASILGYLQHQCWPLREHLAATGKQAVLIAPTLGATSQAGALLDPKGLDRYLDGVLSASASFWSGGRLPEFRHLILAGHSGAGVSMRRLARSKNDSASRIREVWLFDATYSAKKDVDFVGWSDWARSHPDSTLYAYFIPGTPTADQSKKLRDQKNRPPNIQVFESSRAKEANIHAHFWVPIRHWRERIEGSATLR